MDLEVDRRGHDDEGKISAFERSDELHRSEMSAPYQQGKEEEEQDEEQEQETSKSFPVHMQPEQRGTKKRRTMRLFWFIALAVAVAVAAIVAGIAGSIAVNRQKSLSTCLQTKDTLNTSLTSASSSFSCLNNPSKPSNGTGPPSIHDIKPTSECKTLTSPFSAPQGSTYNLECGIDLIETQRDIVGVYVYTFRDCLIACANYNANGVTSVSQNANSTCYAVSFNFALSEDEGNCWLKGTQKIPFHANGTVDSAILAIS